MENLEKEISSEKRLEDMGIPSRAKIPALEEDRKALYKYLETKQYLEKEVFPKIHFTFDYNS
jgi:hypothetical protein